jgi:K+-transporting ATPase ATPase A chain
MTTWGVIQLLLYVAVLVALVKPLGWYMARVYQGQPCGLDKVLGWFERHLLASAGNGDAGMGGVSGG